MPAPQRQEAAVEKPEWVKGDWYVNLNFRRLQDNIRILKHPRAWLVQLRKVDVEHHTAMVELVSFGAGKIIPISLDLLAQVDAKTLTVDERETLAGCRTNGPGHYKIHE